MKTWIGVAPCPHARHMHGTRECGVCWKVRYDREWAQRFPDEDERLPFDAPVHDTDYGTDAMYAIETIPLAEAG